MFDFAHDDRISCIFYEDLDPTRAQKRYEVR